MNSHPWTAPLKDLDPKSFSAWCRARKLKDLTRADVEYSSLEIPPREMTAMQALNRLCVMAEDITGSYRDEEREIWQEWIGTAHKAIRSRLRRGQ